MFTRRLIRILRRLSRKNETEEGLSAELRAYLDEDIAQKISQGMAPREARRAALVEFGGIEQVKEHVRTSRPEAWLDSLMVDCRYALRALARRRSFTTIAVLTIALGIGAATSMFVGIPQLLFC